MPVIASSSLASLASKLEFHVGVDLPSAAGATEIVETQSATGNGDSTIA
jgi:hypothetical protein